MTTPTEVPVRFPPKGAPSSGPAKPAGSGSSVSAFLKTRNGKLAAGGALVVGYALYRRMKTNAAAAAAGGTDTSGSSSASGAGVPTGDTTATDLYSQLEPLIESSSGFTDAQTIEQQLAALQAGLAAGQTTGTGTSGTTTGGTTTSPAPGTPLQPNQVHQVGQVGKSYKLMDLIKAYYPKDTSQQDAEIGYATIANDPALGSGTVPGGTKVTFWSQGIK